MATTKSISARAVKNKGGVGVNLGSVSTVLSNSSLGLKNPATGSVVVNGNDTDPALSGPTNFAYNNRSPVAVRLTKSLAGAEQKFLLSGANTPTLNKAINKIESVITRRTSVAFRAGLFNIYTGTFTSDPTVATDTFHKAISGSTYIDNAANVSKSNPGKAVYLSGSKVPVANAYGD